MHYFAFIIKKLCQKKIKIVCRILMIVLKYLILNQPFQSFSTAKSRKLLGIFLVMNGLFLFISFCSYLFTWQEDNSLVTSFWNLFSDDEVVVKNLMGFLGAYFSYIFIVKGFGLASFVIAWLLFIFGAHLIKPLKR